MGNIPRQFFCDILIHIFCFLASQSRDIFHLDAFYDFYRRVFTFFYLLKFYAYQKYAKIYATLKRHKSESGIL